MNKFILYLKAIKMLHKPEKGAGQVLRGAGQGSLTLERAGYALCGCHKATFLHTEPGAAPWSRGC